MSCGQGAGATHWAGCACYEKRIQRMADALRKIAESGHSLHATSCLKGLNQCCRCIASEALKVPVRARAS